MRLLPLPSVLLLALGSGLCPTLAAAPFSGLAGLSTGGTYGMFQGLRGTVGERRRIRINSVLNGVGRSGPLWGNSLGCIGACCSSALLLCDGHRRLHGRLRAWHLPGCRSDDVLDL